MSFGCPGPAAEMPTAGNVYTGCAPYTLALTYGSRSLYMKYVLIYRPVPVAAVERYRGSAPRHHFNSNQPRAEIWHARSVRWLHSILDFAPVAVASYTAGGGSMGKSGEGEIFPWIRQEGIRSCPLSGKEFCVGWWGTEQFVVHSRLILHVWAY